jgi:VanZ family protein
MFWRNHWKSILWAAIILFLSAFSGDKIPRVDFIKIPNFDKFVHFSLYYVFSILLISGGNQNKKQGWVTLNSIKWAALVAITYGLFIELLQHLLFTSRSADFLDIVANVIGFVMATLSYKLVNQISRGYI